MNTPLPFLYKLARRGLVLLVDGLLIVSTPLAEKNPAKIIAQRAPLVLSMARVVVLAFAVAMLRQIWVRGVGAWPAATLSIAVVLALPILAALDRVKPGEVVTLARSLIGRFGIGAVETAPTEPSKFDDHRSDAG
ncbi:MAG TPA: hypothetical protein VII52_10310 [Gemmatimonadaceae bacterium]